MPNMVFSMMIEILFTKFISVGPALTNPFHSPPFYKTQPSRCHPILPCHKTIQIPHPHTHSLNQSWGNGLLSLHSSIINRLLSRAWIPIFFIQSRFDRDPSMEMKVEIMEMEVEIMEKEVEDGCTTPKNPESRIPEPTVCPPAPRKKPQRRLKNLDPPQNGYFNPPDLESRLRLH